MSWGFDDLQVGGQLQVGTGVPPAIGQGKTKINGSAHIEGPVVLGDPLTFPEADATVMITPLKNDDEDCPKDVFNSLTVDGHQTINNGNLHTTNLLTCAGQGCVWTASTINVQGWKGFDIKHPTRDNYRLRYVCLEGPEGGVYYRGRVINKTYIDLPDYWEKLVDPASITVSLTPIGAHQSLIVKRLEPTRIHLQSNGGIPINAFFHVFGARADGEALTPEYEGETPEDYPGDNSQYSIAGYHYDRRTL